MADKKTNNIKSFIPWIIVGVLVLGFDAMKVLPMTQEWLALRDSSQKSKTSIQLEKVELNKLEKELEDINTRFEYEAQNYVLAEEQIYPETFNAYNVSKILELFSLQHSLLRGDSLLRIERITFSEKQKGKEESKNQETLVKLEIKSTDETLRRFVNYIQTGMLPEEFINNKSLEASDMDFLMTNKLPIAQIDAIRTAENKEEGSKIKVTSLDITFFTQH